MDRREFILRALVGGAGLLAGGAAVAQQKKRLAMEYRYLGPSRAGVSVIGGNETYKPEIMAEALKYGVNYWHKAGGLPHWPDVFARSGVKRSTQIIEICMDDAPVEQLVQRFKAALRRLRQDYVEVYKMHMRPSENHLEAFEQLRQQGLVKLLALSQHDLGDAAAAELVQRKLVDHVQVMLNPAPNQTRDKFVQLCRQAGVGVMAMKVKMGGPKRWQRILENQQLRRRLQPYLPNEKAISQALIKWALAQPGVVCVQTAMSSVEQFREDVKAGLKPMTEGEAVGVGILREALVGHACAQCGRCEEACPNGLAIADMQRAHMYATAYEDLELAERTVARIPRAQRAEMCEGCGACEQVCPMGLPIRQRLAELQRILA